MCTHYMFVFHSIAFHFKSDLLCQDFNKTKLQEAMVEINFRFEVFCCVFHFVFACAYRIPNIDDEIENHMSFSLIFANKFWVFSLLFLLGLLIGKFGPQFINVTEGSGQGGEHLFLL